MSSKGTWSPGSRDRISWTRAIERTRRSASRRASRPAPAPTRRACRLSSEEMVCRLFLTRWWTSRMAASLESSSRSSRRTSVTSRSRITAPVTDPWDSERDAVHQHDDVGAALDLLDHRPAGGQRPLDRRLLDAELGEPAALGRASRRPSGGRRSWRWARRTPPGPRRRPPRSRRRPAAPPRCPRPRRGTGRPTRRPSRPAARTPRGRSSRRCWSGRADGLERRPAPARRSPCRSKRTGIVLDRHRLAEGRVVDRAPHDPRPRAGRWPLMRQLDSGTVWPTRSCSSRVGRLLGRIWPEHHHLGLAAGVVGVRGRDRHHQQQVGEGEVGQHRPGPEQPLEVPELVGPEVGVLLGQLGRGGHRYRRSPVAGGHRDTVWACRRR